MLKPTCPLPDIREARIDPSLPVNERLRLFAAAIGDPHRFRVRYAARCGTINVQTQSSACRLFFGRRHPNGSKK